MNARARAAIVAVGSEMLGPFRRDTNSIWLTGKLEEAGIAVVRKAVVPDDAAEIARELTCAAETAGWIFMTGGLGPTADDLTVSAVAAWMGVPVHRDEAFVAAMRERGRGGAGAHARGQREAGERPAGRPRPGEPAWNRARFLARKDGTQIVILPGVPPRCARSSSGVEDFLVNAGGEAVTRRRVLRIAGMGSRPWRRSSRRSTGSGATIP